MAPSRTVYVASQMLCTAAAASYVMNHFNRIEGASMAPTLSSTYSETGQKDMVFWDKWSSISKLQRGDVVQFMNPYKPTHDAVKRVIALEGDTVLLDRRRRPTRKTGPEPPEAHAWDAWKGKAVVPEGHVWVEGDNVMASRDSNTYGPISKSLIQGRAHAVVWPPSKFWTKPWQESKSQTVIVPSQGVTDWTSGLPVELAEATNPHRPP